MAVITLDDTKFDETVQNHDLVVVDFWAKWCGPCLAFAPVFEQVAAKHPDAVFAKVDIDAYPQLANDFNIRSIPTLMIFRREFAVFSQAGTQTATSLDSLVSQAKQINIEELRKQVDKS